MATVTLTISGQITVPCSKASARHYEKEGETNTALEEKIEKLRERLISAVEEVTGTTVDEFDLEVQDADAEE